MPLSDDQQSNIGQFLTNTSAGSAAITGTTGWLGWIESNSIIIGFTLTLILGTLGLVIQYRNLKLNERRVKALEAQSSGNAS
jgi:hypothetical protein